MQIYVFFSDWQALFIFFYKKDFNRSAAGG
jgi:hypothetical protein